MVVKALNHMAAPGLRYDAFLALAKETGCIGVEFRNDLPGDLFDGDDPSTVREAAGHLGLRILALAEVKSFNDWSDDKYREAEALCRTAAACGAQAVSLISRNDGKGLGNGERQANLRAALRGLAPLLKEYGLTGLIEPLGFEQCSLRHKAEAVEIMEALGVQDQYKLVHDTFHHHIAGETAFFPQHTGIIHISGVTDPTLPVSAMADRHRKLVDARDRLENIGQIRTLQEMGYSGPVSFEPFAPEVHALEDRAAAIRTSFEFISSSLAASAA